MRVMDGERGGVTGALGEWAWKGRGPGRRSQPVGGAVETGSPVGLRAKNVPFPPHLGVHRILALTSFPWPIQHPCSVLLCELWSRNEEYALPVWMVSELLSALQNLSSLIR